MGMVIISLTTSKLVPLRKIGPIRKLEHPSGTERLLSILIPD